MYRYVVCTINQQTDWSADCYPNMEYRFLGGQARLGPKKGKPTRVIPFWGQVGPSFSTCRASTRWATAASALLRPPPTKGTSPYSPTPPCSPSFLPSHHLTLALASCSRLVRRLPPPQLLFGPPELLAWIHPGPFTLCLD
jgi:hypothetical protein